jgi:hypothetical protein
LLLSELTTSSGLDQIAATAFRQWHLDVSWLVLIWDHPSALDDVVRRIEALVGEPQRSEGRQRAAQLYTRIEERSQVFLESLLGPRPSDGTDLADSDESEAVVFRLPLASSRRFALLPVPVDHRPTAWATEVRKEEPRPNEPATRSGGSDSYRAC